MILIKIFITAYIFCILPFLLGTAFMKMFKCEPRGVFGAYTAGYIVFFSGNWMFWVVCMRIANLSLQQTEEVYNLGIAIAGGLCLLYGRRRIVHMLEQSVKRIWRMKDTTGGKIVLLVVVTVLCVSILFTVPAIGDLTPEIVLIAKKTGIPYAYQPYTGLPYIRSNWSFLEMVYVVGSDLAGVDGTKLIHLFLPVFLLPFFMGVYEQAGYVLFGKCKKARQFFFTLAMSFYGVLLFTKTTLGLMPFQNIWNGVTLFATCVIPLVVMVFVSFAENENPAMQGVFLGMLIMAAQLCFEWGGLYALMLTASLGVVLAIRKGYEHGRGI